MGKTIEKLKKELLENLRTYAFERDYIRYDVNKTHKYLNKFFAELSNQVNLLVSLKFTGNEKELIKSLIISQLSYLEYEVENNPKLGSLAIVNTKNDIKQLKKIASKFSA